MISRLFNERNKSHIGVDITSTTIRMLEFARKQDKILVKHIAELPRHCYFPIAKTVTKRGAVSLSCSKISNKETVVDIDLSERQLEEETKYHFTELGEDMYFDFRVGSVRDDDHTQQELEMFAASRDDIEHIRRVLQTIGLKPSIIDVHHFALYRAALFLDRAIDKYIGKKVSYVNVSTDETTIILLDDNELVSFETLVNKRDCTLQLCEYFQENTDMDVIVLSGEMHLINSVVNDLKTMLTRDVLIAGPLDSVEFDSQISDEMMKECGASFMLAGGLALRGVNYDQIKW